MAYRSDADLEFLREMESEDLNDLVEVLMGKPDDTRWTQSLTSSSLYKEHYPKHKMYLEDIMEEIQRFGGNTLLNVARQGGVLYQEIVRDVANKFKVKHEKNTSTPMLEMSIYLKILSDALTKMSDSEIRELVKELNLDSPEIVKATGLNLDTASSTEFVAIALQFVLKQGNFKTYRIANIIANVVWKQNFGHGLSIATGMVSSKLLTMMTGPVGWVLGGVWTALDISGPAYRVTVPVVIQVACLRSLHRQRKNGTIDKDGNEIVK